MKKRLFQLTMSMLLSCVLFCLSTSLSFAETQLPSKKMDMYLLEQMKKNCIPGLAVAITYKDQIIYAKGFGSAGRHRRVTADTPFAIASLTKSFTAMAILQLVEAGKLKLDTPVQNILPSFHINDPRGSKITVRHLLNQTSGLSDAVNPDIRLRPQPQTLDAVIQRLQTIKLASTPGQKHNYHNPNYEILARIVEVVSNESFSNYLQRHIFQPLQMKDTTHADNIMNFTKVSKNISEGHSLFFGFPINNDRVNWFSSGSHGIVSTIHDMAKWLIVQQNHGIYQGKKLLSPKGINTMHTPASTSINYGMGWMVGETTHGEKQISHNGTLGHFKSEMILLPDKKYGIVFLANVGFNEFINFYGISQGIIDLLMDREPPQSWINYQTLSLITFVLILLTIGLGIRSLKQTGKWETKLAKQPVWWTILKLILRLIPLYLLLLLQPIYAFISNGREMSWEGLLILAPCLITFIAIAAFFNIIIVSIRLLRWRSIRKQSL